MSECISRHGEYGSHQWDSDRNYCRRCGLERTAWGAELKALEAVAEAARVAVGPNRPGAMPMRELEAALDALAEAQAGAA